MKKLIIFILPILLLGGCSLTKNADVGVNTGDIEKITQLEEQLSGMIEQFSGLQAENDLLKEYLSGAIDIIKTFKAENELLQTDLDKYQNLIIDDEIVSNIGSTITGIQGNIQNTGSQNIVKEIGLIKQVYIDQNGNRKLEIDYVQLGGSNDCDGGVACIINQNPKLRTFVVSNNVQVIMQTLSHTPDGNFSNNQIISFDYFRQKFNDNTQYSEYPHNYSSYLKAIPFRVTIENNVITKIEEQYMS